MLSINTNLSLLIAQNSMQTSTNKLNQAIERMTTGAKINHAKDNAANYSINTNMTTKISAYDVAADNVAMGMDMVSTAEETLSEIQNKLSRLRALQEQASNGTYGGQSLKAINTEVNALVDEIERLYATAEYNGIKLFEGKKEEASFINEVTERDTTNMTTLASVTNETQPLAADTYSISTPEELEKLARITNSGNLTDGCEFVLAKDIDLSSVSNWTPIGYAPLDSDGDGIDDTFDQTILFNGTFDGNGHEIIGLTTTTVTLTDAGTLDGLFFLGDGAHIQNLGVEGTVSGSTVGLIAAFAFIDNIGINIDNCYTKGSITAETVPDAPSYIGGLIGAGGSNGGVLNITNCYSTASISCNSTGGVEMYAGGLLGFFYGMSNFSNSYSSSNIKLTGDAVGCAGGLTGVTFGNYTDCYYTGSIYSESSDIEISAIDGNISSSTLTNTYYDSEKNPHIIEANGAIGKTTKEITTMFPFATESKEIIMNLQVGIMNNASSEISFKTSFVLENLADVRNIGANDTSYLVTLDNMLKIVSGKLTEFGSVSNRLDSVLDEILIQQDNLVASRSTIRDADIAEVSSQYIQQQILQEASATLLASTKNIQYQNVLGLLQGLRG